jgi:polysaccharide deacetylase family protein (PEP-CTERM system associated)
MNVLTFDLEEWFHILDHDPIEKPHSWRGRERRFRQNMDQLLEVLDRKKQPATFFCLGWIAEQYPDVVRVLDDLGYEIGSHSHTHGLVYKQTREQFTSDLERSVKTLEDLTGKKIKAFRAPGFSIIRDSLWAFEVLVDQGIEVDSSVDPASHAEGGLSYRNPSVAAPSLIRVEGVEIKEFPINTYSLPGMRLRFSGGGYFRIHPYPVIQRLINRSDYTLGYFHPRDFDDQQPILEDLSAWRRFKMRVGTASALDKLEQLLDDFDWVDLRTAVDQIEWEQCESINLHNENGTATHPNDATALA